MIQLPLRSLLLETLLAVPALAAVAPPSAPPSTVTGTATGWFGLALAIAAVLMLLALWRNDRLRREVERCRAEEALHATEERYHQLFEQLGDAVLVYDLDGRVLEANAVACRLLGYDADRLRRMSLAAIHSPAFVLQEPALLTRLRTEGQTSYEAEQVRADGRRFPVWVNARYLPDYAGRPAVISVARDIAERRELERELLRLAATDALTNTLNRRHFLELAQAELSRAHRYGSPFTLLLLDIDHFKAVNDHYGHDIGDRVLRRLTEAIQPLLRESDLFGRLGGEEFAILLPSTQREAGSATAERLREAAEAMNVLGDGEEIRVTISIGVCDVPGGVPVAMRQVLRCADQAMYRAKEHGRNRVEQGDIALEG